MRITIPFVSKKCSETVEPLRRVVQRTANSMCCSEHAVATMMTYFLENIVLEVATGQAVTIPGFGMFAAVPWESRSPKTQKEVYAAPRFAPSQPFKREVRECCTPYPKAAEAFERYRFHVHSFGSRGKRTGTMRSFTAMSKFRRDIAAQARRAGIDPNDLGS